MFAGLRVSVETQTGAYRHWYDAHAGQAGKTRMLYDYGYIRGSLGTDGDHVDVYLGPDENAPNVYIVDQAKKPRGSHAGDGLPWPAFDEQKVMMGFASIEDAQRAYLAHYNDPRFLLSIRTMPLGEFRSKVTSKAHHGYVIKAGLAKAGGHKYLSRKPDGKGGWVYTYPEDHQGPRAHHLRVHEAITGGDAHEGELHVTHLGDGTVRVSEHEDGRYGPTMPAESLKHMKNDLAGVVDVPASKNAAIEAVRTGKAKLLGKGDDGIAFKAGDQVVKVSTTVPFQPFNHGHRSPEDAAAMLREQSKLGNELADAGVPGMQRSTFVEHGDKGFQIKPFVEIPEKLSREQLDKARASLLAMHEKGYALNDDVQVGIEPGGRVVMFDIGKAAPARGEGIHDEKRADLDRLAHLYKKHGHEPPAETRRMDAVWASFAHKRALKIAAESGEEAALDHIDAEHAKRKKWIEEHVDHEAKRKSMLLSLDADRTESELAVFKAIDSAAKKSGRPRFVLAKGVHKYVSRKPDGKGGWTYEYADAKRGAHAEAQAHLTEHARKPGTKPCTQCKGRGKIVSRQPGLFGGPEQVSSATCRRCKGKGIER